MNTIINISTVVSLCVSCFAYGYARSTYKMILKQQKENNE